MAATQPLSVAVPVRERRVPDLGFDEQWQQG